MGFGKDVESSAALETVREFSMEWHDRGGIPFRRLVQASLGAFYHCILQGCPQLICLCSIKRLHLFCMASFRRERLQKRSIDTKASINRKGVGLIDQLL